VSGAGRRSREELEALVEAQAALIGELRAEVAELRARLAENSRNSSRPPSADGLSKPPATRSLRRPSGRKPGGQPGHEGRHLERVERPDHVVTHVPELCRQCGESLAGAPVEGELTRQVFDLPRVRLWVCEHRAQRRRCACGHETTAAFPSAVTAPAQYGPHVRALVLYLVVYQHVPYDRAAQLLSDWLGTPVSTGTLKTIVAQGGEDLDEFIELVREQLTTSEVCHFDETGARADGRLHWVHSAGTDRFTLYAVCDQRGIDGIDHLGVLGFFQGVAVHDGWASYRKYTLPTHALCNVHHLRELQGAIDRDPDTQTWAREMDRLLRELKDRVEHAKTAGHSRLPTPVLAEFQRRYTEIIALGHTQNPPAERTGRRGPIGRSKTANLLRRLDDYRDQALLFAHDFRVPFDNNLAERDLRMIKLQQKISGSFRTRDGAHDFLAMRSYISTARKHNQNLITVLTRLAEHNPWLPQTAGP
jgi:transposase